MSAPDQNLPVERKLTAQINLYYDVIAPPSRPAPLLVALHGYGASKWHAMREAKMIAPEGFALASLQGPHQHLREPKEKGGPLRFGFGWLTNYRPEESVAIHHRALVEMIEALVNEGMVDSKQIFLLGFSQSCALNYRFAFTHQNILRGVVTPLKHDLGIGDLQIGVLLTAYTIVNGVITVPAGYLADREKVRPNTLH